ncbi:Sas10/Utp3 family protein-like protein [Plenodomus tracheiphilus IPT5]|uniref:Sas10/Utp3 family protein-like protein n=1 Tax=Plenodomus tracheiphilus IPT5 TaxID=1408161 RepID=A0A6A7BLN0_9PLEO|nr:Sas10/Utp3 family protein-like protein [Plenodomus tracheiphilus IPT5]
MAKKRKASDRPSGDAKKPRKEDSHLAITSYEDVADSEDEFLINREKILLDEGPAAKKLRKWKDEDKFLENSDEEVLDDGIEDDDSEDDLHDDDEEGADSDDDEEQRPDVDEDELDGGAWGASKKDYYNADAIETEQDALDEEAEARRIQKKQLQNMTEADFGFDEDEWVGRDEEKDAESGAVVTEVLPQLQITESMSEEERMKIMRTRYPEFEHITREYLRLQPLHDELAAAAKVAARLLKTQAEKTGKRKIWSTPMAITKYRACAAYLAAMAMYFAVLGSTAKDDDSSVIALDPAELHEHPVMESLLKSQRMWNRIESMPVADPMVDAADGDDVSVIEEDGAVVDASLDVDVTNSKSRKTKKTRAERAAEVAQTEAVARRAAKLAKAEQELASLDSLTDKAALKKASRKKKSTEAKLNLLNADDSDFGEETELTAHEAAEKAKKNKSLRFYTSQIAQKANKRDAAGKDGGGDADIPHRERLKDRQARLQAEAEKRGQHKESGPGVALGEDDGASSGDDAPAPPRPEDFEDEDGYYDMVAARSDKKKQTKLDRAAAYALAAKEGAQVVEEEVIGEDGRRMISYQISKNKGLTPHRKKSVRNPRVKKKEKYKEKQKKLKSMKPVFDSKAAAKGSASYGGELTGIKKGLVRSRKL